MNSVPASHPAALGSILGVPEDLFLTEINYLDVAEINRHIALLSVKWTA